MQLVSINRKCVQIPGVADLQWSKALQRIIRNTSLQTLETPEICDQRGRRCASVCVKVLQISQKKMIYVTNICADLLEIMDELYCTV